MKKSYLIGALTLSLISLPLQATGETSANKPLELDGGWLESKQDEATKPTSADEANLEDASSTSFSDSFFQGQSDLSNENSQEIQAEQTPEDLQTKEQTNQVWHPNHDKTIQNIYMLNDWHGDNIFMHFLYQPEKTLLDHITHSHRYTWGYTQSELIDLLATADQNTSLIISRSVFDTLQAGYQICYDFAVSPLSVDELHAKYKEYPSFASKNSILSFQARLKIVYNMKKLILESIEKNPTEKNFTSEELDKLQKESLSKNPDLINTLNTQEQIYIIKKYGSFFKKNISSAILNFLNQLTHHDTTYETYLNYICYQYLLDHHIFARYNTYKIIKDPYFYVFIPKEFKTPEIFNFEHLQKHDLEKDIIKHGNHHSLYKKVSLSKKMNPLGQIKQHKFSNFVEPTENLDTTIQKILSPQSAKNIPALFNILISGHGGSEKIDLINFEYESITGMSNEQFLYLVKYLNNSLPINSLTYLTCYGGGTHLKRLFESPNPRYPFPIIYMGDDLATTTSHFGGNYLHVSGFDKKHYSLELAMPYFIQQHQRMFKNFQSNNLEHAAYELNKSEYDEGRNHSNAIILYPHGQRFVPIAPLTTQTSQARTSITEINAHQNKKFTSKEGLQIFIETPYIPGSITIRDEAKFSWHEIDTYYNSDLLSFRFIAPNDIIFNFNTIQTNILAPTFFSGFIRQEESGETHDPRIITIDNLQVAQSKEYPIALNKLDTTSDKPQQLELKNIIIFKNQDPQTVASWYTPAGIAQKLKTGLTKIKNPIHPLQFGIMFQIQNDPQNILYRTIWQARTDTLSFYWDHFNASLKTSLPGALYQEKYTELKNQAIAKAQQKTYTTTIKKLENNLHAPHQNNDSYLQMQQEESKKIDDIQKQINILEQEIEDLWTAWAKGTIHSVERYKEKEQKENLIHQLKEKIESIKNRKNQLGENLSDAYVKITNAESKVKWVAKSDKTISEPTLNAQDNPNLSSKETEHYTSSPIASPRIIIPDGDESISN